MIQIPNLIISPVFRFVFSTFFNIISFLQWPRNVLPIGFEEFDQGYNVFFNTVYIHELHNGPIQRQFIEINLDVIKYNFNEGEYITYK